MTAWLPDLPTDPPDYARRFIKAIADDDPGLGAAADEIVSEIDRAITQIQSFSTEMLQRLVDERGLVLQLAGRFDAKSASAKSPTAPTMEAGMTPSGNGTTPPKRGLTAKEKLAINEAIESLVVGRPSSTDDEIRDRVAEQFADVLQTAVAQPRPTVGSMVYRVRRRQLAEMARRAAEEAQTIRQSMEEEP